MFKNLNQAIPAGGAIPLAAKPRPTAEQRAKVVTQALLGTGVIILTICGGIAYVLNSEMVRSQAQIAGLVSQEQNSTQITGRYQTTLQSYDDAATQLQSLESTLPQSQYIPTLLQQLQTLAQSTNLEVVSIKPGPLASDAPKAAAPTTPTDPSAPVVVKPAAPAYQTQSIQISVSGTYRQVMTFIYSLPNFPKILSLQGLTFTPRGSDPSAAPGAAAAEPTLDATLLINAYVFDPSTSAAAPQSAGSAPVGATPVNQTPDSATATRAAALPSSVSPGPAIGTVPQPPPSGLAK